jgi:hypothetical protein
MGCRSGSVNTSIVSDKSCEYLMRQFRWFGQKVPSTRVISEYDRWKRTENSLRWQEGDRTEIERKKQVDRKVDRISSSDSCTSEIIVLCTGVSKHICCRSLYVLFPDDQTRDYRPGLRLFLQIPILPRKIEGSHGRSRTNSQGLIVRDGISGNTTDYISMCSWFPVDRLLKLNSLKMCILNFILRLGSLLALVRHLIERFRKTGKVSLWPDSILNPLAKHYEMTRPLFRWIPISSNLDVESRAATPTNQHWDSSIDNPNSWRKLKLEKCRLIIDVDIFPKRDHISGGNANSQQQMILPFLHGLLEEVTFTNGRLLCLASLPMSLQSNVITILTFHVLCAASAFRYIKQEKTTLESVAIP